MKILFWSQSFWPCIGGIETQSLLFVKAMQERGHSFLVVAQKEFPAIKDEEIHEGTLIRRFDFKGIISGKGSTTLKSIRNAIDEIIRTFQPDIVQLDTCIGAAIIVFSMLRNLFSVPVILTVHGPHYGKGILRGVRTICSQVDQICGVSQWVMQETREGLPEVTDKLKLIYNGLPPFQIDPTPLSFSPPVLLMIGRLSPEKGFATGVEAFSILKQKGSEAKLLIAGDGIERPRLESLVDRLGLTDSVTFTGEVQREKIPHVINQANLVLVPSHFESFGLVALEAMQMGRPVIASDLGGLPEILSNRNLGTLVPAKDPLALSEAISHLLDDPDRLIAMGAKARTYALENFTMDRYVLEYETLYKERLSQ